MEYEDFEPDPDDEFYCELCADAYARMFNEGLSFDHQTEVPEWESWTT